MWKRNETPEFELTPPGIYQAVISQVVNLGLQEGYQGGPDKPQLFIGFEFDAGGDRLGRMGRIVTDSSHAKAALTQLLTGLYGKAPGDDWSYDKLMQAQCQIQLVHEPKKDGSGDRCLIKAVLPPAKGQNITANLNIFAPKQKDVHENRDDLPDWLVEKAMEGFMRIDRVEMELERIASKAEQDAKELEDDEIPF